MPNRVITLSRKEAERLLLILSAYNQLLGLLQESHRTGYSRVVRHVQDRLNGTNDDKIALYFYEEYKAAVQLFEWFANLMHLQQDPGYNADRLKELRIKVTAVSS